MIIKSFIRSQWGLRPVQVEVVLTPGTNHIQILGLPDQSIKESSKRILSALRYQGFRMPPGKQALVNLEPSHLRKTSLGLDFPIALGILLVSEQINSEIFDFANGYCYGGLSLRGDLIVPEDLKLLNFEAFDKPLLTGASQEQWRFDHWQCPSLNKLTDKTFHEANPKLFECQPRALPENLRFSLSSARLMAAVALGEHSLLLAGSAGCGKTTLIENLARILREPEPAEFLEAKKYWMMTGRDLVHRPILQPHHTVTPVAMIGGGTPLRFGEITLAHGGALLLDELLEFHPQVQSALREPMEKGVIHLARHNGRKTLPARSLILATTNLCPCGNFKPGSLHGCRCSSLKLRSYIERMTGPFLDRFSLFQIMADEKLDLKVEISTIKAQVDTAVAFQRQSRNQKTTNQALSGEELLIQLESKLTPQMLPYSKSHRRRLSLLRVARSLADLEPSERIRAQHVEEAQSLTARDIYKLEQFRREDFQKL